MNINLLSRIATAFLFCSTLVTATYGQESKRDLNLQANQQRLIQQAMIEAHNDTAAAAKSLGISEAALKRKLKVHPVSDSQPQPGKKAAPESAHCVVYNLKFRYTKQAQGNSGKSHGKVTHVWCDFNELTLGLNEMEKYHRSQKGILDNTYDGLSYPAIVCRQTDDNDSPPVEITWAILEDIYGYDAIKENKIPPECRLGATATAAANQGAGQ